MEQLDEYLKNIAAYYKAEIVEHGCNNLYKIKTSTNKYGIIADTLRTICKPEYDEIYFHSCPYNNFHIEEFPFDYPFCVKVFQNGMKVVFNITGDGYGYVDLNNNFTRYSFYPSFAKELNYNYIWIDNQVIDITGQIILSIECESQLGCRCEGDLIVIGDVHAIIFPNKKIQIFKKGRNNMRLTQSLYSFTSVDRDVQNISYYNSIDNRTIYKLGENNMYTFVDENLNNYILKYYDEICGVKVRSKNGWGKINERLEEIIPPRYTWIHEFISDWAYVGYSHYHDKIALRHINGKEINLFDYSFTDEDLDNIFEDGLLLVCHREYGYGFIDEDGNEAIKCKYHSAEKFVNGLAKVRYDTEFGYINKKGELLIEDGNKTFFLSPQYGWGWKCECGYIKVQNNNLYGLLNENGKEILPCVFPKIEILSKDEIIVEKTYYGGNFYSPKNFIKYHKKTIQNLVLNKEGCFVINNEEYKKQIIVNKKYDWIYPYFEGIARVEKNGNWGYINLFGEEIIFFGSGISINDFSCGVALIHNKNNNEYYYINSKGQIVIDNINSNDGFFGAFSFKDNYAIINKNHKFGLIDLNGNVVIPYEYDWIDEYDCNLGIIKVQKGSKYGYYSISGEIIIPCKYRSIINVPNRNDLFIADSQIINGVGDVVVPFHFQSIDIDVFDYESVDVYFNNFTNSVVYENSSESIVQNCDKLIQEKIVFKSDERIIFIFRIDNTYIFATTYDVEDNLLNLKSLGIYVKYVIRGVAIVSYTSEKKGMLGIDAKTYLYDFVDFNNISNANPQYTILADEFKRLRKTLHGEWLNQSTYKIIINNNHKYGYSNKLQQIEPKYDEALPFSNDRASVKINNKWGSINLQGDLIVPCVYDEPLSFVNGIAITKISGKYGFVSKNGTSISKCIYDEVRNFNDNVAAIRMGNFWGYLDDKGGQILECKYRRANDFSEGLALVCIDITDCFINKLGEIVISCKGMYDISNFQDGAASATISVCRPGKDDIETFIRKGARKEYRF